MAETTVDMEEPYLRQSHYLRLQLLITELGAHALRKRFDKSFPPASLVADMNKNSVKVTLIEKYKKNISTAQYEKVYPPKGKPPPSSEKFDVSLLVFLLRHACGLNCKARCWDPKKPPESSDVSEEADIARIKNIRNEIFHETNPALEDDIFKQRWAHVEMILMRMASTIPSLHDMKDRIHELANRNLDVLSAELKSLKSKAPLFFHDYDVGETYVETNSYEKAKKILEEKHVLVLTGLPGEGKSTMAARLALDLSEIDKCLNLCTYADWNHVDLKLKLFDTVIIDDMFGARAFDRRLVDGWQRYLPDIQRAATDKKLKVIITMRQYIMEETKQILGSVPLFADGNTFHLSSKDLSEEEKIHLLTNKIEKHDRRMRPDEIAECATKSSSYFGGTANVDSDFQFGFPECADMFVKNSALYTRGANFFQKPNAFFKKCLQDLYRCGENEEKFLALITVWANDGRLLVSDLDLKRTSENVRNIADSFGFDLKPNLVKLLRKSLEYHKNGFLTFNETTGEYSFSHNVIWDMVGLVVSQDYPEATIEFCTRDFMMEYVTIDESQTPEYKIVVKQYQYSILDEKIVKLLLRKDCNKHQNRTDYNFSQMERSGVCPNRVEPKYELDIGILMHPVFKSGPFVKSFLDFIVRNKDSADIFTKPVMSMSGFFYNYGIKVEKLDMCLAAYSVFIGADTFAREVIERDILDEENSDRYMSLLLAAHAQDIQLVEFLLRHGAKVTGDTIYIAAHKNNTSLLSVLLKHPGTNINDRGNAINGNYPLIVAARKGLTTTVQCLVDHGVDLSVQNSDKMTALHKAIVYKHHDISKLLIAKGAPLDVQGGKFRRTVLHVASDMGENNVVKQILQKGTSAQVKDHRGHYAIHCAAIRGHVGIVSLLLQNDKRQATLQITSYGEKSFLKGMTVYHIAVWKKDNALLDALIKMNADPNTGDCYGQTPIFLAIMKGDEAISKKLMATSDIQKPQKQGYTPLHAAIHKGLTHLAAELICSRVNVNAKDKFGKTPLHVACEKGNIQIARKLTENGADIRMVTKRHDTVFHILQRKNNAKESSKSSNVAREDFVKIAKALLDIDPAIRDWLRSAKKKKGVLVNVDGLLKSCRPSADFSGHLEMLNDIHDNSDDDSDDFGGFDDYDPSDIYGFDDMDDYDPSDMYDDTGDDFW